MYSTKEQYRDAWQKAYTVDPAVPLNVDIELASACNARCSFCLYGDHEWYQGMANPDWDGKSKRRFMPKEMALHIIDEAKDLGVPALKFNFRGESVLHKYFSEIVRYAERAGFWELLSNTNGNCPESSLDGLMACSKVMVSLDSMEPATYAKVRIGLSLDAAIKTIDELVKRGHPDLWVRRVVCQDNKDEKFVEAVKARWPSGLRVSEHFAFDRNHYKNESVHGEDFKNWPRRFCGYPAQRAVIEASGKYVPCCLAWEGEFDAGSFPQLSLKEYWDSQWRRNLANELRQGIFKNKKCQNCTSFMAYDRPERKYVQDVEVITGGN